MSNDSAGYLKAGPISIDTLNRIIDPWIPVSEKLPDRGEDVLLYHQMHEKILVGSYDASKEYEWSAYYKGHLVGQNGITHWMPLPKGPKRS
jgi:hypothetical protein